MRKHALQQLPGIEPNVVKAVPRNADIVRTTEDGGLIVEETKQTHRTVDENGEPVVFKHARLDDDGKEVWRKNQQGQDVTKVHDYEVRTVTERYKLEPRRTGKVVKNYQWEPGADELERRRQRELEREFREELAAEAAKRGLTAQELVAAFVGGQDAPQGPENGQHPTPTPPEATETPQKGVVESLEELDPEAGAAPAADVVPAVADVDASPDLGAEDEDTEGVPEGAMSVARAGGLEAYMTRPGHWTMPDGTEETGKKAEIEELLRDMGNAAALEQLTEQPE